MMLVGPCGQSAAAVQLLGSAARQHFGGYARGTFLQSSAGEIVATCGILLGLLFVGMSIFFMTFAIYVILDAAFRRQHKYSLIWWSTIFPCATVNTAFISLATELDSSTFRVLSTILFLVLLIDYFINWGFTIRDIFTGKLLSGKRSESVEKERAKEK